MKENWKQRNAWKESLYFLWHQTLIYRIKDTRTESCVHASSSSWAGVIFPTSSSLVSVQADCLTGHHAQWPDKSQHRKKQVFFRFPMLFGKPARMMYWSWKRLFLEGAHEGETEWSRWSCPELKLEELEFAGNEADELPYMCSTFQYSSFALFGRNWHSWPVEMFLCLCMHHQNDSPLAFLHSLKTVKSPQYSWGNFVLWQRMTNSHVARVSILNESRVRRWEVIQTASQCCLQVQVGPILSPYGYPNSWLKTMEKISCVKPQIKEFSLLRIKREAPVI